MYLDGVALSEHNNAAYLLSKVDPSGVQVECRALQMLARFFNAS